MLTVTQELFTVTKEELEATSTQLAAITTQLQETKDTLTSTKRHLRVTVRDRDEQRHLVSKHVETEAKLGQQARKVCTQTLLDIRIQKQPEVSKDVWLCCSY